MHGYPIRKRAFSVALALLTGISMASVGVAAESAPTAATSQAAVQAPAGQQQSIQLTLAKAFEIAKQNSGTYKAAGIDFELAKLTYQKAKGDVLSKVAALQAEATYKAAERAYVKAEQDLRVSVINAYYAARGAKAQLDIAKQSQELAANQLAITQRKFAEGLVGKADVLSAERGKLQADIAYTQAQQAMELNSMRLALALGLPANTQFEFTDAADLRFEPLKFTLDEAIRLARQNSTQLQQLQTALEVAQAQEQGAINDAPVQQRTLQLKRQRAEIDLASYEQQLPVNIRSQYYDVLQKAAQIELTNKSLELEELQYSITQARYEEGLEVGQAVDEARIELIRARQASVDALVNYTVARLNLLITVGLNP